MNCGATFRVGFPPTLFRCSGAVLSFPTATDEHPAAELLQRSGALRLLNASSCVSAGKFGSGSAYGWRFRIRKAYPHSEGGFAFWRWIRIRKAGPFSGISIKLKTLRVSRLLKLDTYKKINLRLLRMRRTHTSSLRWLKLLQNQRRFWTFLQEGVFLSNVISVRIQKFPLKIKKNAWSRFALS